MSNKFFQGGERNFRGDSPPAILVTGLVLPRLQPELANFWLTGPEPTTFTHFMIKKTGMIPVCKMELWNEPGCNFLNTWCTRDHRNSGSLWWSFPPKFYKVV